MAHLFCDGFDHYNSILKKWDGNSGSQTFSNAEARFSGDTNAQGLIINGTNFIRKNFPGIMAPAINPGPTIFVFWSFKPVALAGGASAAILTLEDTGTTQVTLALDTLGRPQFYRGNPAANPIGALGASITSAGVYHRLEVKIKINGSTGTVELRVDGGPAVISSSGLNTQATANAYINSIRFGDGFVGTGNHSGVRIDDVFICDDTGSTLKDFLGDRKIVTLMPNGAGDNTQWTPSAGSNYQCVDEIPPNDDTDYVSDATPNDKDDYAFQDATFSGSADFANVIDYFKKDDVSTHTEKIYARSNSVESLSADLTVGSSYAFQNYLAEQDPNTTAAWQQTGFNAAKFGHKVIT